MVHNNIGKIIKVVDGPMSSMGACITVTIQRCMVDVKWVASILADSMNATITLVAKVAVKGHRLAAVAIKWLLPTITIRCKDSMSKE